VWDVMGKHPPRVLQGHTNGVNSVAFAPGGRILATGSRDSTAIVWRAATGEVERVLRGHSFWVIKVAFSPNGGVLATASADRTVILWDTSTWKPARTLRGAKGWVCALAFSHDGSLVAGGGDGPAIHVWDPATGRLVADLGGSSTQRGVSALAFSTISLQLASGSLRSLTLWDVSARTVVRSWPWPAILGSPGSTPRPRSPSMRR
jgi:WD40 repeat protein